MLYDGYIKKFSRDIENIELEEQKLLATDDMTSIHEYVGSTPGLTQRVKDPELPWAVV